MSDDRRRCRGRPRRHHAPAAGQAMVEFALVVPIILLAGYGLVWVIGLAHTKGQVQQTATTVVETVASTGGYTSLGVGSRLAGLARLAGLQPAQLHLNLIDQQGTTHDLGTAAAPSTESISLAYNAPVTITCTYDDQETVPMLGQRVMVLPGAATMRSLYGTGSSP